MGTKANRMEKSDANSGPDRPLVSALRSPSGLGCNLHLSLSPMTHASRMERICRAIANSGRFESVIMVGCGAPGRPNMECFGPVQAVRLSRRDQGTGALGKIRQTVYWMRAVLRHFRGQPVACVNPHSVAALPLAVLLKRRHRAKLVYDTHELETEAGGARGVIRPIYKLIESQLIHHCDAVVVVADSIADWYVKTYGIERPAVVRNMPDLRTQALPGDISMLRRHFGIPEQALIFIYQGGLFRGRRIEQFVRVFEKAKAGRHLVFMGYGKLEGVVREAAARNPNIHFLPAVPPGEVLRHTAGADVGLVGVENACLSYYYSLPNKLFEYVMAGLPVVMPDFPEMRKVAERAGCGWVVGEADADWLGVVNRLDWSAVTEGKVRARRAAGSFSWQEEEKTLLEVYRRLFGSVSKS